MMEVGYPLNGKKYAPRALQDIRVSELRKAAQQIGSFLELGEITQAIAEEILDLIYAELNRRLNKGEM